MPWPPLPVADTISADQITNLGDVTLRGDVRSYNWDGGGDIPDLGDPNATTGFLLDASTGRIQAVDIVATGTIASGADTVTPRLEFDGAQQQVAIELSDFDNPAKFFGGSSGAAADTNARGTMSLRAPFDSSWGASDKVEIGFQHGEGSFDSFIGFFVEDGTEYMFRIAEDGVGFPLIGSETISGGAITISSPNLKVDTESAASSDDLDTISGGNIGDIVILRPLNTARTVVAKNGTGNLDLNGDYTMDTDKKTLMLLKHDASTWIEVSRSH